MTRVCKEYEVKIKMVGTGAMTTAKTCYLVRRGNKNLVKGDCTGGIFPGGRECVNFLAVGGTQPPMLE